jgi:sensor histidine kinase YesM
MNQTSKSTAIAPGKRKWVFPLVWVNLAVVLMVLIQIGWNRISNVRDFLQALAYALVYANLTGVLGLLIVGDFAVRLAQRKIPLAPFVTVGIVLVTAVGCLLAQTLLRVLGFGMPSHFWREYFATLRFAMPLAVVFGLGALVHGSLRGRVQEMEAKLHEKEMAEERAQKLAAEARLRSLESRIHPHFLFNTLNSISSLIAIDPAQAEQTVGRLATLLRASLDTSNQPLISLEQELVMVKSYLEIERVRFRDKLRVSVNAPAELLQTKVPPMSVQSLVENAVKYGVTPKSDGGDLRIKASADTGIVRVEVQDTGPGFDLASIPAGHGLDNLVQRLDALFGAQARLNVLRRENYTVVEMVLPHV